MTTKQISVVLGITISLLSILGTIGAVFMRVGSMQTTLEDNKAEILMLRENVQQLNYYVRDNLVVGPPVPMAPPQN
jgi:hypothetical protein